jgi:beta-xylosidase
MSPKTYRNPIIPGFNPDPSIVRVGNDYFVATSTFEYFPGVPIYHSVDLVNWTLIGHALSRPSQLDMRTTEPSGGIFAPTLRYHEKRKRFYMTTSVVHNLAWGRVRVLG